MQRWKKLMQQREFHLLLFFFFLFLFFLPVLRSDNGQASQAFYSYMLVVWGCAILALHLVSRGLGPAQVDGEQEER